MSPEQKRWFYVGTAALVLLVLAFLSGKYLTPVRVEEKVRVEKVEVERLVVQEKVRVETVTVERKVEVVRRVFVERVDPSGAVERRTEEDLATTTDSGRGERAAAEARSEQEKAAAQASISARTVERHDPMWKLGLLGGAAFTLSAAPAALGGVQGGVRLGPIWATAQVQTDARARADFLLGVAVEF